LFLSFDFLHTGGSLHAYVGTDHQQSCCGPEQWLWSDDGASPYSTVVPVNTWTHVSFVFPPFDPGATGSIVLKMEAVAGVDFFDNFLLQTAPEPASFLLTAGFLIALSLILRRRARDSHNLPEPEPFTEFDSLE
jgi:hypothetical protein